MFSARHQTSMPSPPALVSLPSIHEMFPEYLMKTPPHSRFPVSPNADHQYNLIRQPHPYPSRVGHDPLRDRRLEPFQPHPTSSSRSPTAGNSVPRIHSSPQPSSSSSIPLQRRRMPTSSPSLSPSTQMDSKPRIRSPRPASPSSANLHPRASPDTLDPLLCSFDVLRSDPSNSSLEHIASSTTFPNRSACAGSSPPQAGVANGSAPAFRVILPSDTVPATGRTSDLGRRPHDVSSSFSLAGRLRGSEKARQISPSAPPYSAIISFSSLGSPISPTSTSRRRGHTPDDTGTCSDDGDRSGDNNKKHVCPTCGKRFNRPSSLRIHVNTHTGATPFRCPWPNCGREFNVNSNMRRHLRNHTAPGFSRSPPKDPRRRRRRPPPEGFVFLGATPPRSDRGSFRSSPPVSSLTVSEDSEDDMSELMCDDLPKLLNDEDEDDELLSQPSDDDQSKAKHELSPDSTLSPSSLQPGRPLPSYELLSGYDRSRSLVRSLLPGLGGQSPLPSLSPSPPPAYIYNPSAPYIRSFTDRRVSTALRPAFNPKLSGEPTRVIKEEAVPVAW